MATVYIPIEINSKNKATVVQVKKGLQKALIEYKDKVLPLPKNDNTRKAAGTINRQQRNALNFLEYLQIDDIHNFVEVTNDTINDYIQRYLIFEKKKMMFR